MIVVGLTGGIGMGKSHAAKVLRRAGVRVFDADAAVHRLQGPGGRAVKAVGAAFPGTVRDGAVDREALRRAVLGDPAALRRLEGIVHPLVRQEERRFVSRARRDGERVVVLDIPLLFETGGDGRVDRVVVVSAPASVQRQRVKARRKMSAGQIEAVIARQMPDREKRRRADVVVRTGLSRHETQRQLRRVLTGYRTGRGRPRRCSKSAAGMGRPKK